MSDLSSSASAHPDPLLVLQPGNSKQLRVLSQEARQELLKFHIGLRLLGEEKTKRLLAYIQVLQTEQQQRESAS
jgi:hypothetical protein